MPEIDFKTKKILPNKKFSGSQNSELNFAKIEEKWQKEWEKASIFKASEGKKKKYYVLEMFPYPSASFLHMGHVRNYTIGDVIARFKRMQGFNVLYPMGYDSFGLPAENAAKKAGETPKKYTENAINKIIEHQKKLGNSYDWSRVLSTHEPEYYKWNQYFFLKFYEKGLVYRKKAPVNFCPNCNTTLANEEVEGGKCWRCDSPVEKRELDQWFFRVTRYADELLKDMNNLFWSDRIKTLQRNWIGKSYGTEIDFIINGEKWPIFTTRPDTIYGVTFMVISAQHQKLMSLITKENKKEVESFVEKCKIARTEDEIESLEKEGVFTGSYAINPLTSEKVPVYAGNFVLADYGSGMVMGVPAHDQRDFEFAVKYKIPIKLVIQQDKKLEGTLKEAYTKDGILTNSGQFSGMKSEEAIEEITKFLENKKLGRKAVNYRIRDWLISRQRYWGTPIPIIYCDKCGIVPISEKELPVLLPEDIKFGEKGNPMLTSKKFQEVKCPKCGKLARRETDTMGGFMDSSWYFLRFCDPKNKKEAFDRKKVKYWMPVDQYVGGIEHAVGHLIYSRFFTKALRDLDFLNIDEPFSRLFNQGIVYKDGKRMSKSYGNTVTQEEISRKYGIDSARLFLMFVASPESNMEWSEDGIEGVFRFVKKLFALKPASKPDGRTEHYRNKFIQEITDDIENFRFNLAIINLMKWSELLAENCNKQSYQDFLKILSPFAPHVCEELWHKLGNKSFISIESWPAYDKKKINEKLEEQEKAVEKLIEDINNIARIVRSRGKEAGKAFVYVLPKEKESYLKSSEAIERKTSLEIKIYAVNDKEKYDPENKAGRAKPGKPALYLE